MGFFDRFKARPLEDFFDIAQNAGFALSHALGRARDGEKPKGFVLCEPTTEPKMIDVDDVEAWAAAHGDKYRQYVTIAATTEQGMPGFRAVSVDRQPSPIEVSVGVQYFPPTAPSGFEMGEGMAINASHHEEQLEEIGQHVLLGMTAAEGGVHPAIEGDDEAADGES